MRLADANALDTWCSAYQPAKTGRAPSWLYYDAESLAHFKVFDYRRHTGSRRTNPPTPYHTPPRRHTHVEKLEQEAAGRILLTGKPQMAVY